MNEQVAVQNILRGKLSELQARNPSLSVRAFAMRLGLQPAATNEILKGERRISRRMAERIAERLHLDPSERNELLKQFPKPGRQKGSQKDSNTSPSVAATPSDILKLTADQYEAISEWRHFAILSLVKVGDFHSDPVWIASRLGITERQAQDAIERLLRLKLLCIGKDGSLTRSFQKLNTTDDVLSPALQRSHSEDMDLARQSLVRDPVTLRDFTAMTMAISPRLLPKAKELIRKAQDEIADLLESEPASEVYRLSVYLYPLTQLGRRSESRKKENKS